MAAHSAGILFYRRGAEGIAVLLVHPGGPLWWRKDAGAWQIPKGLIEPGETPEAAARREVGEELGVVVQAPLVALGEIRQAGGKRVTAFAAEQAIDADAIASASFTIEWPPRSGRIQAFPEVDAARWMPLAEAESCILPSQQPLLARLAALVAREAGAGSGPSGQTPWDSHSG